MDMQGRAVLARLLGEELPRHPLRRRLRGSGWSRLARTGDQTAECRARRQSVPGKEARPVNKKGRPRLRASREMYWSDQSSHRPAVMMAME